MEGAVLRTHQQHNETPMPNRQQWHELHGRALLQKSPVAGTRTHQQPQWNTNGGTHLEELPLLHRVRVTKLSDLKTSINEYNIRSEILSMGMGIDNPQHIKQLQKLCEHAKMLALEETTLHTLKIQQDAASPQSMPEQDAASLQNVLEQDAASPHSLVMGKKCVDICSSSQATLENDHCDAISELKKTEESTLPHHKCFYPEIKWFQKEDTVTIKIKIRNIHDHKCEFFRDEIVFSAFSGGKFYVAEMKLHANIHKEKSVCVIKNEEPMIILAKDKKEFWCHLLKHKNPNVSLDFEHWEDLEDKSPFPVGVKKVHRAVSLITEEMEESSEYSGTESDD